MSGPYLFYGNVHPFSNFAKTSFEMEIGGKTYNFFCGEQAIMAWKAHLFGDMESFNEIMQSTTPSRCKAFGRKVRNFDDGRWMAGLRQMIDTILDAKLRSNPKIVEVLNSTKGRLIAEASATDRRWGIGLGEHDPNAMDPQKWRGTNELGEGWMRARARWCSNFH